MVTQCLDDIFVTYLEFEVDWLEVAWLGFVLIWLIWCFAAISAAWGGRTWWGNVEKAWWWMLLTWGDDWRSALMFILSTREDHYEPCERECSSVISDFAPSQNRSHKEDRRFSQILISDLQRNEQRNKHQSEDFRDKFRYSSLVREEWC